MSRDFLSRYIWLCPTPKVKPTNTYEVYKFIWAAADQTLNVVTGDKVLQVILSLRCSSVGCYFDTHHLVKHRGSICVTAVNQKTWIFKCSDSKMFRVNMKWPPWCMFMVNRLYLRITFQILVRQFTLSHTFSHWWLKTTPAHQEHQPFMHTHSNDWATGSTLGFSTVSKETLVCRQQLLGIKPPTSDGWMTALPPRAKSNEDFPFSDCLL